MNDLLTRPDGAADDFPVRLRSAMHRLADAAPTAVRQPDELDLATVSSFDAHRGNRRRAVGIGGTIALVAGAVGMGAVAFNAASDGGGAGTPEEAVVTFIDALDHEDVFGVLEIVDPAEVDALRPALEDAAATAQRLELLGDSFALDGIAGVDISTDDVQLTTETIGPDVAAVVATGGALSASLDLGSFPLGDLLAGQVAEGADGAPAVLSGTTDLASVHPPVVLATVQRDGRWYVSASYTIAEVARRNAGVDLPSDAPIAPVGADSPEAVARELYDRLLAGDLAGAIALAAPGEGDALRAYAELWLPGVQAAYDEQLADGLDVALESASFTTSGDGERRTVRADAFVLTGTVPADWAAVSDMRVQGDPTVPTLVRSPDGSGYALIPAGAPVPATVDGLAWTSWEVMPPDPVNYTYANPDGTVVPVDSPDTTVQPAAPMEIRVERADDGCMIFDPDAADVLGFSRSMMTSAEYPWATSVGDDGTVRICDIDGALVTSLALLFGGGAPLSLPPIATVEVDGRWYVSPIGTVATAALDVLRDVEASGDVFGSDIASLVYGTTRSQLTRSLAGVDADLLTDACRAVAVVGPSEDGTGDVVTGIVDDPSPADARQCQEDAWNITSVEVSGGGGLTPAPPASVPGGVAVPETVPADTAAPGLLEDTVPASTYAPVATEAP